MTVGIVFTLLVNIIQKEPVSLKRTLLTDVQKKILIVVFVVQNRKQMKVKINGTSLNLHILIAIGIVILNHQVNKRLIKHK